MNAPRTPALDALCINSLRVLAMDAVEQAKSGHPGTPMGLASLAYALWTRHLRHNPSDPHWPGRDRFVLSCGHASMLLYGLLHLSGYDLELEDLRQFRQWESRTPGHPEHGQTPGVETTTGPLGQGLGNAVGMALTATHRAALFTRPGYTDLWDQRIWFVASDGDLMEGISHEAASLAGHLGLGRLIGFFDDNRITIDGPIGLACSDDVARRFAAYGWHVQHIDDGNDLAAIDAAARAAVAETERPSLVIVRTHIGFGSPNKQDTAEAHGAPLGPEEVRLTKAALGWPWTEPFYVPVEARAAWLECRERGARLQDDWQQRYDRFARAHPEAAREFERRQRGELPPKWEQALPRFGPGDAAMATREASGKVLNAIAPHLPELVGGSADLSPSNNTRLPATDDFSPRTPTGRNLRFGVREHGMGAVLNGMALFGGVRPYGGTFLVFCDYMRPAIRLAALMRLHVIYVFTHDSIGLGEDGPTHQPVEALAALRCMPNLLVLRPADAAETVAAWHLALVHRGGPVALVLTRQKVAPLPVAASAPGSLECGGYVLHEPAGVRPALVLLASGSEVGVALEAARLLDDVAVRVVSMPSLELFAAQPAAYRDRVLPRDIPRLAIEAAHPMPWWRWLGSTGDIIGIERFGASAPASQLFAAYGFSPATVAARARSLLLRSAGRS